MRTERLHLPCPQCNAGRVVVHRRSWVADPTWPRRTTWADEPATCSAGCPVPSPVLERLLRAVDAGLLPAAHQLPLDLDTAWAGQTVRLCAQEEAA